MTAGPARLTSDDNLFVAMEQVLGLPVVNQCVWVLGPSVSDAMLDAFADRLRLGRLSRLVVRTPPPTRDRWRYTPAAGAVVRGAGTVAGDAVDGWATAMLHRGGLDSVTGPAWRLDTAPIAGGGTAVSLMSSHVVGDGAAVLTGVAEAVRGGGTRGLMTPPTGPVSAARDGLSATGAALAAAWRLRVAATDRQGSHTEPPVAAVAAPPANAEAAPLITVTVDEAAFTAAAAGRAGTVNTLFVAVVLGVLEASGRVRDGDAVPVTLPMATRTGPDLRANASAAATMTAIVSHGRYRDLSPLRAASKQAFTGSADRRDTVADLATLAQILPDAVVRRLAAGTGAPLCLASNLGVLPDDFAGLGGPPAPVTMRSTTVGATVERLAEAGGGLSAWAARSAGLVTLSFAALDPTRIPDTTALRHLVVAELDRYGLSCR